MQQEKLRGRFTSRQFISALIVVLAGFFLAWPALAQEATESQPFDVNPYLNLLALALVIERLLEIGITLFFPGLAEKKASVKDDPDQLAKLKANIMRITMAIGIAMGVVACILWQFGILDEIFPGKLSALNLFNHLITGIIAGAGADPVHQLVLILVSVRERLRV
jgi:hypothetical protein